MIYFLFCNYLLAIFEDMSSWLSPMKEKQLLLVNQGNRWGIHEVDRGEIRTEKESGVMPGKEA